MKKGQRLQWHQKTRHHRCPRRWGGITCRENIIILPRWEHDAWHRLVNHMYPTSTARQLNVWHVFPAWQFVAVRVGTQFPDHSNDSQTHDTVLPHMTRLQRRTWYTFRRVWQGRGVDVGNPHAVAAYVTRRYLHPDFTIIAVVRVHTAPDTTHAATL